MTQSDPPVKKTFGNEERKSGMPIMSDDLRNTISRLKGETPGPDITSPEARTRLFPVSAEDAAQKKAEMKALVIGRLIPGKGVFVGRKNWIGREGASLGIFNLFAAPKDLLRKLNPAMTFNNAVPAVADIDNLLGYKGGHYANHEALYKAIISGAYQGEWFIPPREILLEDLYKNKDKGELSATFWSTNNGSNAHWYWSCTECINVPSEIWRVRFAGSDAGGHHGQGAWGKKEVYESSVRLVRAEPA